MPVSKALLILICYNVRFKACWKPFITFEMVRQRTLGPVLLHVLPLTPLVPLYVGLESKASAKHHQSAAASLSNFGRYVNEEEKKHEEDLVVCE